LIFSPVRELAVPKGVNCFDYCTKANVIITAGEYTVLYSFILKYLLLIPGYGRQGIFNESHFVGPLQSYISIYSPFCATSVTVVCYFRPAG